MKNNEYLRLYKSRTISIFFFFFCVVVAFAILLYGFRGSEVYALSSVALFIAVLGFFQDFIKDFLSRPSLVARIQDLRTNEGKADQTIYYNLLIKNTNGIAKNLQLKIKDDTNKEWMNLKRPFGDLLRREGVNTGINISSLSKNDEEHFNICAQYQTAFNQFIEIKPLVTPNNQKFSIQKEEEKTYFLKLIGDNIDTIQMQIKINCNDFGKSTVEILKNTISY